MSALGQKRSFDPDQPNVRFTPESAHSLPASRMSALGHKRTFAPDQANVRFAPKAVIRAQIAVRKQTVDNPESNRHASMLSKVELNFRHTTTYAIANNASPIRPRPIAPNQNGRRLVMMATVESAIPISKRVAAPVSQ